jgi:hypothetical protein
MAEVPHEWLTAYLAGDLTSTERVQFETHLLECPECGEEAERLSPLVLSLRRLGPESVEERPDGSSTPRGSRARRLPLRETLLRSAIAVAAAVIGVLLGVHLRAAASAPVPVERIVISSERQPATGRIELYQRPWGSELSGSFVGLPRSGMLLLVVAGPGGALDAAVWHATSARHASIVASVPWSGSRIRWMRLYVGSQVIGSWSS